MVISGEVWPSNFITARKLTPARAFLRHRCDEIGAERCEWKGRLSGRPDASNRGVDGRVLLSCADGPGVVHRQAADQESERSEDVGRVHTQTNLRGPSVPF